MKDTTFCFVALRIQLCLRSILAYYWQFNYDALLSEEYNIFSLVKNTTFCFVALRIQLCLRKHTGLLLAI